MNSGMLARAAALACAMLAAMWSVGCETNPTTSRSQLLLMSLSQESELGAQAKPQMLAEFGGAMARADINTYVSGVGRRLLGPAIERDQRMAAFQWEFLVLDSDVINAFALPGGKVFISRGLMQKMNNEAQLAAVLGHEVGHVMARHGNERVSRSLAADLGLQVASNVLGGSQSGQIISEVASQSTTLFLMSYDRRQESESDSLGSEYMVEVKYDPMGAVQVMEILQEASKGNSPPEILSTHPDPGRRAEDLRRKIAEQFAHTQGNPEYQLKPDEFRSNVLRKITRAYPHAGEPRWAGAEDLVPEGAIGVLDACAD
ncbi:Beta-barrel assembly-enhancing protease [Phycisphaerales bacterium]|nr:Beta-barrel assembly-enhancing protease [Phycisphaerales bacterium]